MRWISTICGLVRPGCGLDHDHLVMWPRCEAYSAEASQLPRHRQSKVLVAGERACERYLDVRASLWPGEPVGKHLGKQPTLFGRTLRRAPTYPGPRRTDYEDDQGPSASNRPDHRAASAHPRPITIGRDRSTRVPLTEDAERMMQLPILISGARFDDRATSKNNSRSCAARRCSSGLTPLDHSPLSRSTRQYRDRPLNAPTCPPGPAACLGHRRDCSHQRRHVSYRLAASRATHN